MMVEQFDLIVVGAGPGVMLQYSRCSIGMKVAVIEKDRTCL